ncbi:PREDICTED: uncharacterized protein LOC105453625 [Wasmannia auropunctata]|uniref:uncharacterized protein LOC105453625 n=1 Tax=Wasmannia auropunctata TaxID=64793 RepID=UPI0005EE26CD|nr:PREDICTED: uncharacterized protein LOC105453625 [Wasmannia auropunctata]
MELTLFTKNFYVIQFDDGIALVPNNWLQISEDQKQQVCFYPNYNVKKRLNKAIQNKEIPDLKNVQAGWAMYDVLRILSSADTFERGQEKLKMAENISDINTEDEDYMKKTRHDRAAANNLTSDDESVDIEVDSGLLSPLPDPKEFSGSQKLCYSKKPALILATYENPIISEKDNIVVTEKKKPKIIRQEIIAKPKKKELENKNQKDFITKDNEDFITDDHSIDKCNKELTTHQNEINGDKSQKVFMEILRKVNRLLVEVTYIDRRLSRLENKIDYITNKEINVNNVEEAFVFDTISSVDELKLFEENLKNEKFFTKMKSFLKLKGGSNLQDMIKNTFKALIKDEILMLYSWKGARGKNAFRNFKIVSLIIAVVRLHNANSTEEGIIKVMTNWIVQAPARVRRIANKQKNQNNQDDLDHLDQVQVPDVQEENINI